MAQKIRQQTGQVASWAALASRTGMSEHRVRQIMEIPKEPISLQSPVGEDPNTRLVDIIEDPNGNLPAEIAVGAGIRAAVQEALDSLSHREAKVLRLRFGIDTVSPHSLEEVARHFDLGRERIRMIEINAIRKLTDPSRAEKLRHLIQY